TDIEKYGANYEALSTDAALRSERITCQLRNLVYITDFSGKNSYLKLAADAQGITISQEHEILSITLPGLLPKRKVRTNMAFLHEPLSNVGLMIFDEGHLFDDLNRGIAYELLISTIKLYMPNDTQKVLISAVIPNAQEINGWLTDGNGEVVKNNVIQTTEKTVSIADTIFDQENKKLYTQTSHTNQVYCTLKIQYFSQ
ncbi:MAG: DUF6100 family protein, partial [Firmicutes bacterium]|nr:DUF6100 family protein [Bacillota bacterium]